MIVCDAVRRPKGWQVAEIVELDESAAPPPAERPERSRGFDHHEGGGFRREREGFPRRDSFKSGVAFHREDRPIRAVGSAWRLARARAAPAAV